MKLLKHAGFLPYLAIAFLNASVDLAHKITIQNVLLKSFEGNTLVMLTALINAMILLPFIFLFSPSAFINDKFCRTKVIRWSSLVAVGISGAIFSELSHRAVLSCFCVNSCACSTKCSLFACKIQHY